MQLTSYGPDCRWTITPVYCFVMLVIVILTSEARRNLAVYKPEILRLRLRMTTTGLLAPVCINARTAQHVGPLDARRPARRLAFRAEPGVIELP